MNGNERERGKVQGNEKGLNVGTSRPSSTAGRVLGKNVIHDKPTFNSLEFKAARLL